MARAWTYRSLLLTASLLHASWLMGHAEPSISLALPWCAQLYAETRTNTPQNRLMLGRERYPVWPYNLNLGQSVANWRPLSPASCLLGIFQLVLLGRPGLCVLTTCHWLNEVETRMSASSGGRKLKGHNRTLKTKSLEITWLTFSLASTKTHRKCRSL